MLQLWINITLVGSILGTFMGLYLGYSYEYDLSIMKLNYMKRSQHIISNYIKGIIIGFIIGAIGINVIPPILIINIFNYLYNEYKNNL
jgi:hypothetical protein